MLCKLAFSLFKVWKSEKRRKKDCVAPNVAQSSFQRCDSTSQATRNHILQASVPYHKFRGNKREREREIACCAIFTSVLWTFSERVRDIGWLRISHPHQNLSHTPFRWASTKKLLLFAMPCLPARSTRERERKWESVRKRWIDREKKERKKDCERDVSLLLLASAAAAYSTMLQIHFTSSTMFKE